VTSTNRQAEELAKKEKAVEEKALLLKEVLLRVKNNTRMILSLLALQTGRVGDPEARREAGELVARALGIIHERLERSEAATVDFAAYLRELCDHLARFHAGLGVDLSLSVEADPVPVTEDEAVTLGLIVNELVAGAAEHAFPNGHGEIHVEFNRAGAGRARLTVSDDGQGQAAVRREDLGRRLVAALAAHLGAEVVVAPSSRRDGARVTIIFSPETMVQSQGAGPRIA
jgi:two-component system, sensor histidine kinase PdtaS